MNDKGQNSAEAKIATGSVAMINSDVLDDVTLLNGGYPERFGNRTGADAFKRARNRQEPDFISKTRLVLD